MPKNDEILNMIGIVVIGRNEGIRLKKCLQSIPSPHITVVYVDSGSKDASVALAKNMATQVVELDSLHPFCAARARNAGYQHLLAGNPGINFVQFIDADCEIVENWLSSAVESLMNQPDLAIVAGWLRERYPEISIYNRLGDLEWNSAGAGETDSVGGIFMVRREAFDSVGGFDPTVAAGEEPELCQRLVRQGWRLMRLDRSMATHDLAMTRFSQWWRRMIRSGYGSMDVGSRFGVAKFVRNNRRVQTWMAWVLLILVIGPLTAALAGFGLSATLVMLLLSMWPAQLLRITVRTWRRGQPLGIAMAYAFFIMLSFLPQAIGQIMYFSDRSRNHSFRLVEYKTPNAPNHKHHD